MCRGLRGQVVLAATTTNGFAYDDTVRQNGVFTAAILAALLALAALVALAVLPAEARPQQAPARHASSGRRGPSLSLRHRSPPP